MYVWAEPIKDPIKQFACCIQYYVYVTCYASHDTLIEKYVWSVQVIAPVKMLQVPAVTLNTSKDTGVRERVLQPSQRP